MQDQMQTQLNERNGGNICIRMGERKEKKKNPRPEDHYSTETDPACWSALPNLKRDGEIEGKGEEFGGRYIGDSRNHRGSLGCAADNVMR